MKKTVFRSQDRAFLGVTTLKDLVLKRPQGPMSTEDFLQTLLELTMSDIELVGTTEPWTHWPYSRLRYCLLVLCVI